MKKILLSMTIFLSILANAQVGIDTDSPDESAILDVVSTNKGVLFPRMSQEEINNIEKPANGLLVFNTTYNRLMVNVGSTVKPVWQKFNNGTLAGNINCSEIKVLGDYYENIPLDQSNKLKVPFDKLDNGGAYSSYQVISNEINGISFKKVGDYYSASYGSPDEFDVPGTGTPVQTGTYNYILKFNQNECPFTITVNSGTPPVQIGKGSKAQDKLPLDTSSKYYYSESLYYGSEINQSSPFTINNIAYYKADGSTANLGNTKVYMKSTDKDATASSSFSSYTYPDYENEYELVYDGVFPNNINSGWIKLNLSSPFVWNTSQNLSIIVISNNPDISQNVNYYSTTTDKYRSVTVSDQSQPNYSGADYSAKNSKDIPNIRFNIN